MKKIFYLILSLTLLAGYSGRLAAARSTTPRWTGGRNAAITTSAAAMTTPAITTSRPRTIFTVEAKIQKNAIISNLLTTKCDASAAG